MIAVALPGRAYPVELPAVAAVTAVVARHAYDVRPVAWTLDTAPDDPAAWVADHLAQAAADGCDLVVAKSLGTFAAPYAAQRGWPAIWVTPVLRQPDCVAGIRANPAPQLLVCGGADPLHDADVAAILDCEVLELPGLDHALSSTGDQVVPHDAVARITAAVEAFVGSLT